MSIHIKTGDKWHTCASVHVNVSGTWHTCRQVYVKTGDAWHKCIFTSKSTTKTFKNPLGNPKSGTQDDTVTLSNVKNGSEIKITGKWTSYQVDGQAMFGVGAKNATPITAYYFQAEVDKKWYWFPKAKMPTTSTAFTVKFKATSTSVTLYLRSSVYCVVTDGKVTYTEEGYFD